MVEKILKFLVVLVFAAIGFFLMEIATPLFSEFVSSDYLKVYCIRFSPS